MRHQKLVRIVLLSLAACLLADVGVSVFLIRDGLLFGRPLPPFGALTHPRQRAALERMTEEQEGPWVFDAELGWTWMPSSADDSGTITVNSIGARGPREYAPLPPEGKRRVVLFGDSFTFCDEVPDEDAFGHQLEGLAPDLEVLNFGISGYGTDQALLRFRRVGLRGADVACLGLLLENIGRNVNRYRPLWATQTGVCMTKPRFVLEEGGLRLVPQPFATRDELHDAIVDGSVLGAIGDHEYWLGRPPVPTGRLSSLVRIATGYLAYRERTPAVLWSDPDGEPFRVTLALVEAFQREARAAGARHVLLLLFGARREVMTYAVEGRPYWTGTLEALEARAIPTVDLISVLTERARADGGPHPGLDLFAGSHLSRKGNGVVAQTLLERIRELP